MIQETNFSTCAGTDVTMNMQNGSYNSILNIKSQLLTPLQTTSSLYTTHQPIYHAHVSETQQQQLPNFDFYQQEVQHPPHHQQHQTQQQHETINFDSSSCVQQVCGINLTATDTQLIELAGCLLSLDSYPTNSNSSALKEEAANISDASTVEENNNDADDAIAYLQGLNSGNLMQCSQQSAVQELLNKESFDVRPTISELFHEVPPENDNFDIKPNLDVLPTFEEHDIGGYKFQLNPRSYRKGKINGTYSEKLNKIYLRRNEIFCIDAVYTPKTPSQHLRIRAVLCFATEVCQPVQRCQNHISQETDVPANVRHSLMRCENPSVEYCGSAEGKSINDRYSVLIPLGLGVTKTLDNSIKQTIALKFTCQNSCIGRKETRIIFLLESMKGEVLSQRVVDVKICSCPKRDRGMDERTSSNNNSNTNLGCKRKQNDDDYHGVAGKKIKQDSAGTVKLERSSSFSDLDEKFDAQMMPNGEIFIKCQLTDKRAALHSILSAHNMVGNQLIMAQEESKQKKRIQRIWKRLKRIHDKVEKM